MKQNNKKFNNAMHKFVGVLDKYGLLAWKICHRNETPFRSFCASKKQKTSTTILETYGSALGQFYTFNIKHSYLSFLKTTIEMLFWKGWWARLCFNFPVDAAETYSLETKLTVIPIVTLNLFE